MRKIASWPLLLAIPAVFLLTSCASFVYDAQTAPSPAKTTPVITWAQPAAITNPTPLGSAQLDATANVPGTFVYTPAAGTVLSAGTQTLSTSFTPTDTAAYNTATASVTIVVIPGASASSCPPPNPGPITGSGHLAVSDDNRRVLIFDAPYTAGECASVVLGQPDMSSYTFQGEGPKTLEGPVGLSMDAAGNLYVADANNDRVVQFQPPFTTYMDASLEVGVPSFDSPPDLNTSTCYHNPPSMSLCMPTGVTLDKQGNVWVADLWEGRVVEYEPPIQQAMDASLAIGQPDMNHTANCDGIYTIFRDNTGAPATTTASDLCDPVSAALDPDGNLWVADAGNDRVLEFVPPLSTGMAASVELGFPADVGMSSPTPFADGWKCPPNAYLCRPDALVFDANGDLWVSDGGNNRVLEFVPPFTSGMAASLVIGQPDFTHGNSRPAAANTLYGPLGLTFDANGDLIITDDLNNRVLIFAPPFSNGMSASTVIGQPDFISSGAHGCNGHAGSPDGRTFCHPDGVLAF